jgi:hypothetical protein
MISAASGLSLRSDSSHYCSGGRLPFVFRSARPVDILHRVWLSIVLLICRPAGIGTVILEFVLPEYSISLPSVLRVFFLLLPKGRVSPFIGPFPGRRKESDHEF